MAVAELAESLEHVYLEQVVTSYRKWLDHWQGWITRKAQIRALAAGSWSRVFGENDVNDIDLPMVQNFFRDTIEDGGRLFGEMLPMERRYSDGSRGQGNAEEVEQVINGYTQGSGVFNYPEFFGMDMIACGLTAIKVWPSYSRSKVEGGLFPRFRRLDPDFVVPDPNWQPDQPTERVCVHYTESVARLEREFPEQMGRLMERVPITRMNSAYARQVGYDLSKMKGPTELAVLEWYATDMICRCVYYKDDAGFEAEMLTMRPNETGVCPVQIAHRPTWAREPLGQLDDSKGIVRTQNRYMRLILDYFVEMVYGGKLVWNVKNPTDRGPGTRYFALGPDAKMESVTPEVPSFQAFQVVDRLEDAARSSMNNPASREGDVQLNKATAAYLTRAQGKLSSGVRGLQRSFAVAKRYANEAALAQDEAWCNQRKTITGIARGKRYKVTYTPKDLIKGDHSNLVTYGTSSGLDGPTHSVLWLEKLQSHSVSLETYLENDPAIDDVPGELSRLAAGELRESILLGLKLPETPLAQRARAFSMFAEGKTLEEVAEALLVAPGTPGVPGMAPGGAAATVGAPPGIPGAEGSPGPMLPPPAMLRSKAAR